MRRSHCAGRNVATRTDKTARSYHAFLARAALGWLWPLHTP